MELALSKHPISKTTNMKKELLLTATIEDIVFDGRNKDYGAYELRTHYQQRIGKALLFTGMFVVAACAFTLYANAKKENKPRFTYTAAPTVITVKEDQPLKEPEKQKEPEKEVKTEKYIDEIKIVDKQVVDPITSINDLDSALIGDKKIIADPYDGKQKPVDPTPDDGKGVSDIKPTEDNGIHETVEVEARFNGDWKRFLERNLNPEVPVNNSAPEGWYSVVVRFVVDKEGYVSDIEPLTNHGYGMEQEAVRVLRKAAKWEPAFQNGIHVKAYRKQVIVFEVSSE